MLRLLWQFRWEIHKICSGKPMKCSWGSKPTPPGTASNPLPPPAPAPMPGLGATDILAYERQLAMSKMGSVHALMHARGQHPLNRVGMGMGMTAAGASGAIYDGGYQNMATAQQMICCCFDTLGLIVSMSLGTHLVSDVCARSRRRWKFELNFDR